MDLIDSRIGFGSKMTWPAMLPLMGITIDHILVSKDITVLKHEVGPNIGSDHYPVYYHSPRFLRTFNAFQ